MGARPRVLVLTSPADTATDLVLRYLDEDGVPYLRRDTAEFPTGMVFTASAGSLGWHVRLDDAELDELTTVYYRRPGRFAFNAAIPPEMITWCEGQARYGVWGVLESLPALWVNLPGRVSQAEYKPRQLAAAAGVGLPVPPTLITNNPQHVAEFAAAQPQGIITKALYARTPRTPGGTPSGVLHTTAVPPEQYSDPAISLTAHLFQARQPKTHDVRVTVVGHTMFAAEIHSNGALDWRRDHQRLTYRSCEVPEGIAEPVLALMEHLGLAFAALDFVATADGWVFLEVNPNGQWAWIERQTRQPISRALADLLKGPA